MARARSAEGTRAASAEHDGGPPPAGPSVAEVALALFCARVTTDRQRSTEYHAQQSIEDAKAFVAALGKYLKG